MAVYTDVEIEYSGGVKTIEESLIVDNKYHERDDENRFITEYFLFSAVTIDSATITYDTGSDDPDWVIDISIVKVENIRKTFAMVVTAPYNSDLIETHRIITINGVLHADRNIGPYAECSFSFDVENECITQRIDYVLSSEYVNSETSLYFDEFFSTNSYSDYFEDDEEEHKIYNIVARGGDSDYNVLLQDADTSLNSTKKKYFLYPYQTGGDSRIIDKEHTYEIGPGLRSYGNSRIEPVESLYDNDTRVGGLYFASMLHSVGYKTFSFSDHIHYNSATSSQDCKTTQYFNGLPYSCVKRVDEKSLNPNQREYLSSPQTAQDDNIQVARFLKEIYLPYSTKIIGNQAFKYCQSLTTIGVTDGQESKIEVIGMFAFEHCDSLASMPASNLISHIGEGAFKNSGLQSFNTYNQNLLSLTIIEPSVFRGCGKLNEIDLRGTRVYKIEKFAFRECGTSLVSGIETFNLNTNGDNLKSIEEKAFYNSKIGTVVTIPDSVNYIGNAAFYGSKMQRLDFGTGAEIQLGKDAFKYIELTDSSSGIYVNSRIKAIADRAFSRVKAKYIRVSGAVTSIGENAFIDAEIEYIQFDGNGNTMPESNYTSLRFVDDIRTGTCRLKASQAFIDKVNAQGSDLAKQLYKCFIVTNKFDVI